jgi:hypothetical protein
MANIERMLANGGWAIVGVVVGSSLTYLSGALNRHHQEAREDRTRWYDTRREAYVALLITASRFSHALSDAKSGGQAMQNIMEELTAVMGAVSLVASPATIQAAKNLFEAVLEDYGATHQEFFEATRHLVENREVELTHEELDFLEEQIAKVQRSPSPKHRAEARAAFEEAARRDLGQGPSGGLQPVS